MDEHRRKTGKLTRLLTMVSTLVMVFSSLGFSFIIMREKTDIISAFSKNKATVFKIIIDAGHGGEDGGAQSSSGITEKYINLAISEKVNDIFRFFGYETIMTRKDDSMCYDDSCNTIRQKKVKDIKNRMNIIEENPNSVFLSIHQNHYSGSDSFGTQVFYSQNNEKSEILAQCIQSTIVTDIQQDNKRTILPSGDEIYLLYHSNIPSVMVECGFLSNEQEAIKLNTEEYQSTMAFEIFKGTQKYLGEQNG